jgi:hypothetical protein
MAINPESMSRVLARASLLASLAALTVCTASPPDDNKRAAAESGSGTASEGGGSGSSNGSGGGSNASGCIQGDPFATSALQADVTYLASDELEGRAAGTTADEQTRQFIAERFACLGLQPAANDGSYHQPFLSTALVTTGNVVALVPGADPDVANEIIVVGAHHDHLGLINGEIYNGANDNASGVVSMLAVAQALQKRATPPRRTVVFAAFGSEEHELDGSYYFVDVSPPAAVPIDNIVHMVNLDMVGTYAMAGSVDAFGTYVGTPGRIILDSLLGNYASLQFNLGGSGEGSSDYDDFCEQGIPYLYFETWDPACYHQPCDDADRIDYVNMAAIAHLSFDIVAALADTDMDLVAAREDVGCLE